MFTIISNQGSDNTIFVQAEATGATVAEIISAYKALAEVVDDMGIGEKGGEK